MSQFIINFTPTGMIPTKDMSPHVPISAQEIIDDVLIAHEIGITLVHLHARDEYQVPTYKATEYQKIIEKIREYAPELVICTSLSGRNFNIFEYRSEVLQLFPDMGSLTLSSLNFPKSASVNDPEMIQQLAEKMLALGVKPELEIFDLGMINYAHFLIKKDILRPPFYFNIISGNIAGIQTELEQIGIAIKLLPDYSYWALGGIGDQQLKANLLGMINGGGVRIGLEDHLFYDKNKAIKATNGAFLKRIHRLADELELHYLRPKEFGSLGFYNPNFKR
jgi:3-keto-5-aminohexanoate cleavage enzyme